VLERLLDDMEERLSMKRLGSLLLTVLLALPCFGCGTSCGDKKEPLLWAEGITRQAGGTRIYETTPIDGTWLHFPSYRKFSLPHAFGTKDVAIDIYVSLADPEPVKNAVGAKFETSSSGEALVTIPDESTVIVENTTCENDYYLFVRITDRATLAANE
jgi:hypothetical protein